MENKRYLDTQYNMHFVAALNYMKQNNFDDAKVAFKRALTAVVELLKITDGQEQAGYKQKADGLVKYITQIEKKVSAPESQKEKIPVEQSLAKLKEFVGLNGVKAEVEALVAEITAKEMRENAGLKNPSMTHHLIFAGNPGTGKTTVARIMADIFYSLGIIEKGHTVEVTRKDLVVGYVGQTAPNTQKKIDEAMGGVLFIDEVYLLAEGGENDFGKEAVGVILDAVEKCRGEFVTILAGYESRILDFLDMNPGLKDRFPNTIRFEDYTPSEMLEIFDGLCEKSQYIASAETREILKSEFDRMYENRNEKFGNARAVRNTFEKLVKNMSVRIYRAKQSGQSISKDMLMTLLPEDIA